MVDKGRGQGAHKPQEYNYSNLILGGHLAFGNGSIAVG